MFKDKNKLEQVSLSENKQFIGRKRRRFGRTEDKIMYIVIHDFFKKKKFRYTADFLDYINEFFLFFFALANLNSFLWRCMK
jgi:hypothetical protein